jgi:hypothetical protein
MSDDDYEDDLDDSMHLESMIVMKYCKNISSSTFATKSLFYSDYYSNPVTDTLFYPVKMFVVPPAENFKCSVCLGVLFSPTFCSTVGQHNFCYRCIKQTKKCTICRCEIDQSNLIINQFVKNSISLLQVKCQSTFGPKSCEWTGPLDNLSKHVKTECMQGMMKCPNAKCGLNKIKRDIEYHLAKQCDYREINCKGCSIPMIQNDLDHHREVECPETVVFCTNRCADFEIRQLYRRELLNHKKTTCSLERIECPYFSIGCGVDSCTGFVCRNALNAHVKKGYKNLKKSFVTLVENNTELNTKNIKLHKKNLLKTKRLNNLYKKNDEL